MCRPKLICRVRFCRGYRKIDSVTEKDVDVDTTTDTDPTKDTHESVNGGTANRILFSPDDNHTGCDKNRPKSQVQCCTGVKCVSNCRGVYVAREPVCATGNAAVSHVLKKTSHQLRDITAPRVHVVKLATTSAKKSKNLRRKSSSSLLRPQPLHDTICHHKNDDTSTVCMFRSFSTSESSGHTSHVINIANTMPRRTTRASSERMFHLGRVSLHCSG